jgi:hypothetical protein
MNHAADHLGIRRRLDRIRDLNPGFALEDEG